MTALHDRRAVRRFRDSLREPAEDLRTACKKIGLPADIALPRLKSGFRPGQDHYRSTMTHRVSYRRRATQERHTIVPLQVRVKRESDVARLDGMPRRQEDKRTVGRRLTIYCVLQNQVADSTPPAGCAGTLLTIECCLIG
jgi:hypothetical protein